ncbi:MAG: hypothetical protein IT317_21740 [Anaerolineales bacterium]|nr:hypothetical protein [Anaerolineales bacterium]
MLYQLVVFLHVVGVFGYLLAHGVSAAVAFALKRERDLARVRALLDLSAASYPAMFAMLYAFFLFGVIAGFQGAWWGSGWIWASIVLLVAIVVLMTVLGGGLYGQARKAAGLRYNLKGKWFPPEPAQSDAVVLAILGQTNPVLLTVIGYGGFALIAWLMVAKPF